MRQGTLVTPPTGEPVDLDMLKQHMRVSVTADDGLITNYLIAARMFIEEGYDRALLTQTWDLTVDAFPWMDRGFTLPLWPLQSITSVTYYDINNSPTVWPSSNYFVDTVSRPGRLVLAFNASWPTVSLRPANAVVIRYVAGYGLPVDVPWNTKAAIMLLVEHWYETREPVMAQRGVNPAEMPFTVRSLLSQHEIAGVS